MLTYDPNVGFLFNGQPVNLHGSVGRNVLDASTAAAGALDASHYDPRYYESYTFNHGDSSEQTAYRLRPEYAERLGGRTQLRNQSVGGYGEVIDPSQVTYDEEFGLLTDPRNIRDPATPRDNMIGSLAMAAWALPIAYGVGLNSGLLGGAGSTGLGTYGGMTTGLDGLTGTLAGESLAGAGANLGAYGGMTTGLDGLSTASLTAGGGTEGIASAAQALSGTGSAPWYERIAQYAMQNPMTAARGLLGATSLVNTLTSKPNNSSGGINFGGFGGNGPAVQAFNPEGLLSGYRPMQFDPVPFMSGRYGG